MNRDDSLHSVRILAKLLRVRIDAVADCVDASLTVRELVTVAYVAGASEATNYIGAKAHCDPRVIDAGERLHGAFAMLRHPSAAEEGCDDA